MDYYNILQPIKEKKEELEINVVEESPSKIPHYKKVSQDNPLWDFSSRLTSLM